jgi:hypothetical protein
MLVARITPSAFPFTFRVPIASILDVGFSRKDFVLGGGNVSLADFETTMKVLPPPCVEDCPLHQGFVCAFVSCTNVSPEAYVPARIDAQLDDPVHSFLHIMA